MAASTAVLGGVANGPLTYYAERMNYSSAEAFCVTQGGHLASVHSAAENNVLAELCHMEECWIGYNDIETEGTWVWMDGSPTNFSAFVDHKPPWNPGEPNGKPWEQTDGAYVYPATNIWVNNPGAWDDDDIAKDKAFVCRTAPAPWAPPPPPASPHPVDDGPFHLVVEPKLSWPSAEAHCVTMGGHLASIHSMAENEAVLKLCDPHECWIGFNDLLKEGDWVWKDGSLANFSSFPDGVAPWNPGEPNSATGESDDGAYMYPSTNRWTVAGSWDDDKITTERSYVCRLTLPPPPPFSPPAPLPPPPAAPDAGGGAAVVVILVLLFLGCGIGAAFYTIRQRRAGQPLLPASVSALFQARAQTRPAGSDASVYIASNDSSTPYTPPLTSVPSSTVAPPVFSGVVNTAPPPSGVPGGGWS